MPGAEQRHRGRDRQYPHDGAFMTGAFAPTLQIGLGLTPAVLIDAAAATVSAAVACDPWDPSCGSARL
ncbi:hypothetical protein ACFY5C_03235 [Streptomyces sp. NPDC012935]|uniref:hypothetical protein n=1 Tax=Streptomyces sp. NPDC012935 TaxID=3364857 RepID=UPI0036B52833